MQITVRKIIAPTPCSKCRRFVVRLADDGRTFCNWCGKDRGTLRDTTRKFIGAVERTFGSPTTTILWRDDSPTARHDRHLANLAALEPKGGK